jgi:hypothetical protein
MDIVIEIESGILNVLGLATIVYTLAKIMDLITIDEYKTLNGLTGVKDDEKLLVLIPSISQLVKNYCNNPVIDYFSVDYTEYFDIQWDSYTVQLKYGPVTSVTAVYERELASDPYEALVYEADYWLDTISDSIFRISDTGRYINYPLGVGAVKVVYKSGYSATPTDLKLAVNDLVTYYLKNEHKDRRSLGAATIEYPGNSNGGSFPDYIKRVLDIYRL